MREQLSVLMLLAFARLLAKDGRPAVQGGDKLGHGAPV
jgi:hypothetical protein